VLRRGRCGDWGGGGCRFFSARAAALSEADGQRRRGPPLVALRRRDARAPPPRPALARARAVVQRVVPRNVRGLGNAVGARLRVVGRPRLRHGARRLAVVGVGPLAVVADALAARTCARQLRPSDHGKHEAVTEAGEEAHSSKVQARGETRYRAGRFGPVTTAATEDTVRAGVVDGGYSQEHSCNYNFSVVNQGLRTAPLLRWRKRRAPCIRPVSSETEQQRLQLETDRGRC
jgi:hypothetical protein